MQSLTTYIKNPELLNAEVVEELWQLVDRHPTYQAASLLLVRGLYQLQDQRFAETLRKVALQVPDREKLFELIEGEHFHIKEGEQANLRDNTERPTSDRTLSLIDTFLADKPEEPRPRRQHPADASMDYSSYLMQMEDAVPPTVPDEETDTTEKEEISPAPPADKPTENDKKDVEADIQENVEEADSEILTNEDDTPAEEAQDEYPADDANDEQESHPEDYFTETLARIYIKQCKYDKAIEIIRRLSLNYPKKSRYFADQIRFLEKLILNERYKNKEK